MNHMNFFQASTHVSKVSYVFYFYDLATGLPPRSSNLEVSLRHVSAKPIRKQDGAFVFIDLPQDHYILEVRSSQYLKKTISLKPGYPQIHQLLLEPAVSYPVQADQTGLRISGMTQAGGILRDAQLRAVVKSEEAAWAKLSSGGANAGDFELEVLQNKIKNIKCGHFVINEKGNHKKDVEYCYITSQKNENTFILDKVLQNQHGSALLMPVVHSRTDENGEALMIFRNPVCDKFDVELMIEAEHERSVMQIQIVRGEISNISWTLDS